MITLQGLAKDIIAAVRDHQRQCRCTYCLKRGLQCVDCPECREAMEDLAVEQMRPHSKAEL